MSRSNLQELFGHAEHGLDEFRRCLALINHEVSDEPPGDRTALVDDGQAILNVTDELRARFQSFSEHVGTHPSWHDLFRTE
jgi:hypothetical protein